VPTTETPNQIAMTSQADIEDLQDDTCLTMGPQP